MNDFMPLSELVGFNYSAATIDLLRVMTYDQLSERLGYKSKSSISDLLDGRIPSHVQGEALWALYLETFNRKPPLNPAPSVRKTEPHLST